MFSRIASSLHGETNPLYKLRDELSTQGTEAADLISGNVTASGIQFPQDVLENALVRASRDCRVYRPDSLGRSAARLAISEYYASQGISLPPSQILLTPGTSISYWYCFKLLADDGDEILCPLPSYPLFDYIASLSGVKLTSYPLREGARWSIDCVRLEECITPKTRAIVLISPHNPTGHVASDDEIGALVQAAQRHELAIISDEVFSEFLLGGGRLPRPAALDAPLVLTLNGFSKMLALPGIKLGWMGVSGNPERVERAMRALELISDTFLPVNEVVQAAVPELLKEGATFVAWYAGQVKERWARAREVLRQGTRFEFAAPEGGFYLTLRLDGIDEERAALELLRLEHLLLHPGYFYDVEPHHLVLSFVQPPDLLDDRLTRLVNLLGRL